VTMDRPVGTLLSINVGTPQDVEWRGRTVRTAVWKTSVDGPVTVRRLNIDGDAQGDLAGHGGEHRAVFVYQVDSYRYWQRELGRDDFVYGQFGENFTVDGLADDQVCIGDRYRIGAAEFEVTQPRVTCYRVGIRMDDPRIPALLVSHRRPGFYLRVLTEGAVQAGDEIVQVAAGPETVTVAEVDGLLYLPGHPRDQLARALRVPALPAGWQASLAALLDQPDAPGTPTGNAGLVPVSPPPAWSGFRQLAVTAIVPESPTVLSLELADPTGTTLPAALPGQFVTLRLPVAAQTAPVLRSYSLSGPPGAASYRVSVKREPHGVGSAFVFTQVASGDRLDVAAPRGAFTLRPGTSPVLLVSAGVGATPVLAMLHALAADRADREVWWLQGARSRAEQPFAEEARRLLAQLANAHRCVCFSRPADTDVAGDDYQVAGRLSPAVLAGLDLPHDADAYVCGPVGFMAEMTDALAGLGVDRARIRTETFGATAAQTPGIAPAPTRAPHPPPGDTGTGAPVSFARSAVTAPWDPGYASVLELAEACDVPVRWSCRTGVCHSCETAVISGGVVYDPEPVDEPAAGSILLCCSQPVGDLVLDL